MKITNLETRFKLTEKEEDRIEKSCVMMARSCVAIFLFTFAVGLLSEHIQSTIGMSTTLLIVICVIALCSATCGIYLYRYQVKHGVERSLKIGCIGGLFLGKMYFMTDNILLLILLSLGIGFVMPWIESHFFAREIIKDRIGR